MDSLPMLTGVVCMCLSGVTVTPAEPQGGSAGVCRGGPGFPVSALLKATCSIHELLGDLCAEQSSPLSNCLL